MPVDDRSPGGGYPEHVSARQTERATALPTGRRAALVTLGCARNDLDSEELAGRLTAQGWALVDADASGAQAPEVIVVNTCGFVEQAKKDSIDTVLAASDAAKASGAKVVAVGCLAERYGAELAAGLSEADAVLGFDHYPALGDRLADVLAGRAPAAHTPVDRRTLLPISPARRPAASAAVAIPGHGWVPDLAGVGRRRRRLDDRPVAPLKLASGCDRRCAFCAIPSFRGAFVSRPPEEIVAEATWLAEQGVHELVLVSENSTSYGKDFGDLRALERLLPQLAGVLGIERVRVSYLQPAETRPGLVEVIANTPGVAPYFDLSFQHASKSVLRRMRRFGSVDSFLELCSRIRALAPDAGIRSNVILGFPGETDDDVAELERFLEQARLDAVGVFGYSDEDGTEAAGYPDKVPAEVIAERVARLSTLVEELTCQRAEDRVGSRVSVLVEELGDLARAADPGEAVGVGRAAHQAPDSDGECVLTGPGWSVAELVEAIVLDAEGVDLVVARAAPR
ncbi:MAG: MiaB/RimO family radical SAM methylthiotransferase [Pseudonocardia sp.]|nr:MiaB/RimO family radical SAM methylthiotransferase [Pseudonocardia sp.]